MNAPASAGSALVARLEALVPARLVAGRAGAVFCLGSCRHDGRPLRGIELLVDGAPQAPAGFGLWRADLASDPTGARGGFFGTLSLAGHPAGTVELAVRAHLPGGEALTAELGGIEVVPAPDPALRIPVRPDLIVICMATYDPDPRLFRIQIDSLRAQTDPDWICVISDDRSDPASVAEIEAVIAGDSRFVLSRSEEHLGFYGNFERALALIPPHAALVALSDQDDRWEPDKLATLRAALGDSILAYSDQRLVDADGKLLRDTLWRGRRNNHTNLTSELVANTIAGAAMLFRRELLDLALPFPLAPGFLFHDHWLGLAAMASGEVVYVDRPLYDYVQHRQAVFGHVSQGAKPDGAAGSGWSWLQRARAAYFHGYVQREALARTILLRCGPRLSAAHRHALERFVAAQHSPLAFLALALRPVRALVGRNETLGSEADLIRGLVWKGLATLAARRVRGPLPEAFSASIPDPASFEQRGLRRWRARL